MKLGNDKAKKLREDFPIFKNKIHGRPLVYLDNAATTQKPKVVIDTVTKYYQSENANIHRGVYKLSEEATQRYEHAHKIVGDFVNAGKDEIVFTKGTTESLNLLGYSVWSIADKKRKDIVVTELEHHSNLVPWQQLAKRCNLTLKVISVKDDLNLDYGDAEKVIGENTAILSVNHISNALGTVNNVKKLVKLGKSNGAITILDSAQAAANCTVDVKSIGCDFMAFSGHKLTGPTGIGGLYGKSRLFEEMDPFNFGGDMIKTVSYQDAEWNKIPWKFEAGTPNIAGGIGLGAAVKYLQTIGMENIEKWEKELLAYALVRMKQLKKAKVYNAGINNSAGILSFNLEGIHPHDVASLLDDDAVCVRGGHHCAMPLMNKLGLTGTSRASFYLYNTFEDIDVLVDALKKVEGTFNG